MTRETTGSDLLVERGTFLFDNRTGTLHICTWIEDSHYVLRSILGNRAARYSRDHELVAHFTPTNDCQAIVDHIREGTLRS